MASTPPLSDGFVMDYQSMALMDTRLRWIAPATLGEWSQVISWETSLQERHETVGQTGRLAFMERKG